MNKKLEQEFAELVVATYNKNPERAGRILSRVDEETRERFSRTLGGTFASVLLTLKPERALKVLDDLGFAVTEPRVKKEAPNEARPL